MNKHNKIPGDTFELGTVALLPPQGFCCVDSFVHLNSWCFIHKSLQVVVQGVFLYFYIELKGVL